MLNTDIEAAKEFNKIPIANALFIDASAFNVAKTPSIAASPTVTKNIGPIAFTAVLRTRSALLRITIDAENDNITIDKAPAAFNAESVFMLDNAAMIPARPTVTARSVTNDIRISAVFLVNFVASISKPNMPIILDIAAVAVAKSFESMKERPTTHATNKPIVISIRTKVLFKPLVSFANLVTAIRPMNINSSAPMIGRALYTSSGFILLTTNKIPTNIEIAKAIATSINPAFPAFAPARCDNATIAPSNSSIADTTAKPFVTSSILI